MGSRKESFVPEAAMDSLNRARATMDELQTHLLEFLSLAEPDALAALAPLGRARAFLSLAHAASALLSVRLRCSGIQPDNHPIKTEFERLSLYEGKLEKFTEWSKAPLRPSAKLNPQAAARFIGHSLPNLTSEQRQSIRDISRKEGSASRLSENRGSRKKRKFQTRERQSVREAAKEFLEKAAQELLGMNDCGVKGPLRSNILDEEDGEMS